MVVCAAIACCSNLSCSSPGRNWGLKISSPSQQVRQLTWRCTLPFLRAIKTKVHSSMVIWTATGDTVIYNPEKRGQFTAIILCLQSYNHEKRRQFTAIVLCLQSYNPEKRRQFTAIVLCLQSNDTVLKHYDIHCTVLFNHLSICILTLPLRICAIDRHYCIFLCCVPPWG